MSSFRSYILLLISAVAVTWSFHAKSDTLEIYWEGDRGDTRAQLVTELQARIGQYSGDLTVVARGNGSSLLLPPDIFDPSKSSLVVLSSSLLSSKLPQFLIFDLPFLIRDHTHAMRVAGDPLVQLQISQITRRANLEFVAMLDGGFRDLVSKKPIRGLEDLRGRAMIMASAGSVADLSFGGQSYQPGKQGSPSTEYFTQLGADVYPTPFPLFFIERATDMFHGIVDVIDCQLDICLRSFGNTHDYKYVALTHHASVPLFVLMNQDAWKRLSSKDQEAIRRAASEIQRESFEKGPVLETETLTEFKQQGFSETLADNPSAPDRGRFTGIQKEITSGFTFETPGTAELLNAILHLAPRD